MRSAAAGHFAVRKPFQPLVPIQANPFGMLARRQIGQAVGTSGRRLQGGPRDVGATAEIITKNWTS